MVDQRWSFGRGTKRVIALALGGVSAALAACTTQITGTRVSDADTPVVGQVYYLPRTEFSMRLDRELTACSVHYDADFTGVTEWLRDVLAKINGQTTLERKQESINKVLDDPMLALPEISAPLENKYDDHWPPTPDNLEKLVQDFPDIAVPVLDIKVDMRAQAIPIALPDPKHVYALQYEGMRDALKGTSYTVETYPNGVLKSINVTLDDQTGAFVQNIVQGLAKTVAASSGFPLTGLAFQAAVVDPPIPTYAEWIRDFEEANGLCNAVTRLKLFQRAAIVKDIEDNAKAATGAASTIARLEKALADAKTALEQKKKVLDALPAGDTRRDAAEADVKAATTAVEAAQAELDKAKKAQQGSAEASSKATARLDNLRKELTLTTVVPFSPEQEIPSAQGDPTSAVTFVDIDGRNDLFEAWMDATKVKNHCAQPGAACDEEGWPAGAGKKLFAQAAIYPRFTELKGATEVPTAGISIVYRQPVSGLLFVCKEAPCLNNAGLIAKQENILLSSTVDLPQFGVLASLPLTNHAFQNNTLTAAFSESGALTKLTYQSNARAVAASEAFSASADTLLQFQEAKRNAEKERLTVAKEEVEARTALIKAQTEQEKAQAELDAFREEQAGDADEDDADDGGEGDAAN